MHFSLEFADVLNSRLWVIVDGVITIGVISELREEVNQLKKKNNQLEESLSQVNHSSIEEMRKLKETVNELNEIVTEQNQSIYKLESKCGTVKALASPFNAIFCKKLSIK